ncbi:DUF6266 family protein [Pedobacter sp. JY14-1]|uniref:DUF6266 family protein n=1 Tax=Pedobacter sp. JY14-1 TaxID=3034151 RepID=UPI0023E34233|nr:DUF6266 family protein [Pedobacter sp. JY14-1]
MAKLNGGPFGFFQGRIGNLVSYTLNGENITRTVGVRTKPLTTAELLSCEGMKVIQAFLKLIKPMLVAGFTGKARHTRGSNYYNEAVSYNKKHALIAADGQSGLPGIVVDYPKVLVSSGSLPPALQPALTLLPNGVEFTWALQPGLEYRNLGDRMMALLYFPEGIDSSGRPYAVFELSGARRADCGDFIRLDAACIGKPFQAYIAFSGLYNEVSNSVWIDPDGYI